MVKHQEIQTVKLIGSRLLAEANDLKRTIESISDEIGIDLLTLKKIVDGDASYQEAVNIATIFAENFPVSLGDLIIDLPDHANGVSIMRSNESERSSRVFKRKDKRDQLSDYYEYRDTATSNISPFKPEWIKELRFVNDSNPENPDVAYNNGHFLHQMTAFIGPVNFYWEVGGKKYCQEMNTGDSNYITPFWKHSFTTRSKEQDAIIIAVTFAGNAARARKEMYHLSKSSMSQFILENRDINKARSALISQILSDRCINEDQFNQICFKNDIKISYNDIRSNSEVAEESLEKLSSVIGVSPSIFSLPIHDNKNEVVIKKRDATDSFILNGDNLNPDYRVFSLAKNSRMPQMIGFEFEIIGNEQNLNSELSTSLHSYIYNFGKYPVKFSWQINDGPQNKSFQKIISPGDSIYIDDIY